MASVSAYLLAAAAVLLVRFLASYFTLKKKLKAFTSAPDNLFTAKEFKFTSTTTILPALRKYQEKYGGLVKITTGFFFPFILITDCKFIEYLLTSNKILQKSEDYKFFDKWLGQGLITATGQRWFKARKIITPAFHFQILEQFIEVFHKTSNILLNKLENTEGKTFDIYPFFTAYTLDVICETAMGTIVNSQSNSDSLYVKSVKEVSKIGAERSFDVWKQYSLVYFFSRDYWKERKALEIIHQYTNNVIQSRKEDLAQNQTEVEEIDDLGRKKRLAFLDLLLKSKIDGRSLTDEEIRDEVNTFLFAGHDTTASALTFVTYCLSRNPDVQEKVVEELRGIFGDDKDRPIVYRDLQEMKYLEMVIKETFRLFPPVPLVGREVDEDETFYDGIIPVGVPLAVFSYGLHRNPEVFPDPDKFDPERFTVENQAKRNPFSYLPFSAGPRNCIGQKFAMYEVKTTMAKILRKFEILPVPEHEILLSFETVLKSKTGVQVKVVKRDF